jgi:hypothetical protein
MEAAAAAAAVREAARLHVLLPYGTAGRRLAAARCRRPIGQLQMTWQCDRTTPLFYLSNCRSLAAAAARRVARSRATRAHARGARRRAQSSAAPARCEDALTVARR